MKIVGIIPARYQSTRFPGKPLVDILGKPMIQRVYEQCKLSNKLNDVIVATDDDRIAEVVKNFGGKVCMTNSNHPSGTDRCLEVLESLDASVDAVINIQGDEPFIDPLQIDAIAEVLKNTSTQIATLIKKIHSAEELFNDNSPKVVIDHSQNALYFSRHPIPFVRNIDTKDWLSAHTFFKHIGIYGFQADILRAIAKLKPSSLELAESLEQNRWLENGFKIRTAMTDIEGISIDIPDDLLKIKNK